MELKKTYIAPEAELLSFKPLEGIANDWNTSWGTWARTGSGYGENPDSNDDAYEYPEATGGATSPDGDG